MLGTSIQASYPAQAFWVESYGQLATPTQDRPSLNKHPKYPNPTLQEALVEIHFRTREGHAWSATKPAPIMEKLGANYPEFEIVSQPRVGFTTGTQGITPNVAFQSRLRFKHKSKPYVVQVWDRTFTMNVLEPYMGWPALKRELFALWPGFAEVAGVESIFRVGMRYINRIPRRASNEKPEYWLKQNKYIAESVVKSGPDFSSRSEFRINKNNRMVIHLLHQKSDSKKNWGNIILDIDRLSESDIGVRNKDIDSTLERMHDDIWRVFKSAKGPELEKLLKEKREK